MILSLIAVLFLTVAVLISLVLLTVVPFVRAVDAAERRGFSCARWGWLAGLGCGAGLAVVSVALRSTHGLAVRLVLLVLAGLLSWAVPLALGLIGPHQVRLGGRAGAHER